MHDGLLVMADLSDRLVFSVIVHKVSQERLRYTREAMRAVHLFVVQIFLTMTISVHNSNPWFKEGDSSPLSTFFHKYHKPFV